MKLPPGPAGPGGIYVHTCTKKADGAPIRGKSHESVGDAEMFGPATNQSTPSSFALSGGPITGASASVLLGSVLDVIETEALQNEPSASGRFAV